MAAITLYEIDPPMRPGESVHVQHVNGRIIVQTDDLDEGLTRESAIARLERALDTLRSAQLPRRPR